MAHPRSARNEAASRQGVVAAATAAVLYGVSFWLQGRYVVPRLGALVPTWSYYVLGGGASCAFAVTTQRRLGPPPWPAVPLVLGTTALGCGGTWALAAGEVTGEVAVVTVLSALASVVTVFLARAVLKERVTVSAWVGVALIVAGLGLLHTR